MIYISYILIFSFDREDLFTYKQYLTPTWAKYTGGVSPQNKREKSTK